MLKFVLLLIITVLWLPYVLQPTLYVPESTIKTFKSQTVLHLYTTLKYTI
jgi:hypothetical protein